MLIGMLTCQLGSYLRLLIARYFKIHITYPAAYMQLAHWVGSNLGRLVASQPP